MSKHTPGPWIYQGTNPWYTGGADGGGEFAQWSTFTVSANTLDRGDKDYYFVGTVSNVNNESQNEANACLIAAAPELLEALQGAVALADKNKAVAEDEGRWVIRPPEMQRMYDACVAAIAKATATPSPTAD